MRSGELALYITSAAPDDCPDIAVLNGEIIVDAYAGVTDDVTGDALRYHISGDWLTNKTRHYEDLLRDGAKLMIARVGQKAVGFAMVGRESGLYVSSKFQGSTVTLRLIDSLVSEVVADKKVKSLTFTAVLGSSAVKFYKQIGCVPTGRDVTSESPVLRGGQVLPQIELELSADAALHTVERIHTVLAKRDALWLRRIPSPQSPMEAT